MYLVTKPSDSFFFSSLLCIPAVDTHSKELTSTVLDATATDHKYQASVSFMIHLKFECCYEEVIIRLIYIMYELSLYKYV